MKKRREGLWRGHTAGGALKGNLGKGVSPGPSNELQAENHGACVMYWPCCVVGSVCFSAEFGLKTIPF